MAQQMLLNIRFADSLNHSFEKLIEDCLCLIFESHEQFDKANLLIKKVFNNVFFLTFTFMKIFYKDIGNFKINELCISIAHYICTLKCFLILCLFVKHSSVV